MATMAVVVVLVVSWVAIVAHALVGWRGRRGRAAALLASFRSEVSADDPVRAALGDLAREQAAAEHVAAVARLARRMLLAGAALVAALGMVVVAGSSGGVLAVLRDDGFAVALLALAPMVVLGGLGGAAHEALDRAARRWERLRGEAARQRRVASEASASRSHRLANGSREVVLTETRAD